MTFDAKLNNNWNPILKANWIFSKFYLYMCVRTRAMAEPHWNGRGLGPPNFLDL